MTISDRKLSQQQQLKFLHEQSFQNQLHHRKEIKNYVEAEKAYHALFNQVCRFSSFGFFAITLSIYFLINDELSEPYMDEIFHVDQLHAYCLGNFSYWNTKITTPPGLYLVTIGIIKPFSELYAFKEETSDKICPLNLIRLTNLIFSFGNLFLVYSIQVKLHSHKQNVNKFKIFVSSFSIILLPPLFFFNFLYYTDPGSLFFVLLMYLYNLENRPYLGSIFGFLSLLFRQTNIIWVFMVAAQDSIEIIVANRNQKTSKLDLKQFIIQSTLDICKRNTGYLIVGLISFVFICINQAIVLGDRAAHTATLHLGQIIYFLAFVTLFGWPYIFSISCLRKVFYLKIKHLVYLVLIGFLMMIIIKKFSFAHPYLLADNRHFTFYIWKRIFNSKKALKLIPIYLITLVGFIDRLNEMNFINRLIYLICILLAIVPAYLLEFRYFIIAFLIWRLQITPSSKLKITLELLNNFAINLFTLYIFFWRIVKWPNDATKHRIIW